VKQYLFHTRRFLSQCFGNGALSLGRMNLQDISQCIVRQAKAISPNAAQRMTVALRSFLTEDRVFDSVRDGGSAGCSGPSYLGRPQRNGTGF
jgi:hypothetical protein